MSAANVTAATVSAINKMVSRVSVIRVPCPLALPLAPYASQRA